MSLVIRLKSNLHIEYEARQNAANKMTEQYARILDGFPILDVPLRISLTKCETELLDIPFESLRKP